MDGDTVIWYFIGTYAEYDRLLRQRCVEQAVAANALRA